MSAVEVRPEALGPDEALHLVEYEAVIQRGLQTFVEVGTALAEIRDQRLYRSEFATFEDYCRQRWGFTDRRARQIVDAAGVVAALPTGTTVPVNEAQARELVGLDAEQAAQVVELAEQSGTVTAASLRTARQDLTDARDDSAAGSTSAGEWEAEAVKFGHPLQPCHPMAIVPLMADQYVDWIADSVAAHGLIEPIVVDRIGRIVDGRLRYLACLRAGVPPRYVGLPEPVRSDSEVLDYVISANVKRTHLTEGQRAMVALRLESLWDVEAAGRR